MNTVRIEKRRIGAGEASTRLDPRALIAVASMFAVFGGFFAIGRATNAGSASASRAEAPSSLPVASGTGTAAIPTRLVGAPPEISSAVVVHERPHPRIQPVSVNAAPVPAQAFSPAAARAPLSSSQLAPTPTQSAPAASPAPAPTPSAPVRESRPSSERSAPSGGGKPSGGGSFESSG